MARLTIRGEARSANAALEKLDTLIKNAEKSTLRLLGVSKSLAGHYQQAVGSSQALIRTIETARTGTQGLAKDSKQVTTEYRNATSQLSKANAEASKLRTTTMQVARAARVAASASGRVRSPGPGRVGPPPLPAGAGRQSLLPSPRQVSSFGRVLKRELRGAGRVAGLIGTALTGIGGIILSVGTSALSALGNLVSSVFQSAFRAVFSFVKIGLTTAIVAAAAAGGIAIKEAIATQPISEGFGALTEARGLGEQASVLRDLQVAARGTVSELELMRNANTALQLGAAQTTEQLQFLIVAGRRLGKVLGRSATEGFTDLAVGIGRQSRLVLDNLGLIVRVEDAHKAYAKSVGATVRELGEAEKRLAFTNAAYGSIREKMQQLGTENDLAVDGISRLNASFRDLGAEVAESAAPAITDVTNRWSKFVSGFDAQTIRDAMSSGVASIKSGIGSILDFIFGGESAARQSFGDLGGALFTAITNPSEAAFKIVGVRFRQLFDVGVSIFRELWDKFGVFADEAMVRLISGPFWAIADKLGFDPFGIFESFGEQRAGIGRVAEGNRAAITRTADADVARIMADAAIAQEAAAEEAKRAALFQQAAAGRASGASGSKPGGVTALEKAAAAEAALREEKKKAAAEQKKIDAEKKKAAKALLQRRRDEMKALQASIRETNRLTSAKKRELAETEKAQRNLSAALSGDDVPFESVAEALNSMAEELRGFVPEFAEIRESIDGINQELAESAAQLSRDLDEASRQFQADLKRRSRSFLLGGEVEGETTRVRSLRRRARRERRRQNREVFQRELGSRGFSDIQGPVGGVGFGAQNIERQGGILDNIPAGLEAALAQIINDDGGTLIADQMEQIAEIVSEAAERNAELNDRKSEALNKQEEVQQAQLDAFKDALELEEKSLDVTNELADEVKASEKKIKELERQLDEIRRKVRANA